MAHYFEKKFDLLIGVISRATIQIFVRSANKLLVSTPHKVKVSAFHSFVFNIRGLLGAETGAGTSQLKFASCRAVNHRRGHRIFFAQNATGKHHLDAFPTWSMYLWYIRSIERSFKPNLTCWAVGWKSVASQYVDFRLPDPYFGYFSPNILREKTFVIVILILVCTCDILKALREDLNPICLLER